MIDRTIAALFVQTGGAYFGLDGVEPYDINHDAMTYRGPHPVVCHSPCARWGHAPDVEVKALVSWCGNRVKPGESRPRVGKAAAAATPIAFRDELVAMPRTVRLGADGQRLVNDMSKQQRSATPPQFRDLLVGLARTVK